MGVVKVNDEEEMGALIGGGLPISVRDFLN
jgi:hypothetical protein